MPHNSYDRSAQQEKQEEDIQETGDEPLIIQYTNLLHQYRSPRAEEVQAFLRRHEGDSVFQQRADVLNKVFQLKEQLVK